MANNAILNLQIIFGAQRPPQAIEDLLAQPTTAPREFMQKLINELSALAGGLKPGVVIFQLENATTLTKSSGTIALTGLPVADETVTVAGTALTWKASAANENQVTIGADAAASAENLKTAINAHSKLKGIVIATRSSGTVTVTSEVHGRIGNLLGLAEASSNLTVGAAVLAGAVATQEATTRTFDFGGTG